MASYRGSGKTLGYTEGTEMREPEGSEIKPCDKECTLCEDDTATYFCQKCDDYLCNDCQYSHKKQRKSRTHDVVLLRQETRIAHCLHHPTKEVTGLCRECLDIACSVCVDEKHSSHTVVEINKCKDTLKNLCQDLAKKLRIPFERIIGNGSDIKSVHMSMTQNYEDINEKLKKRRDNIRKIMNTNFSENREIVENDMKLLDEKFANTQKTLKEFKRKCEQTLAPVMTIVLGEDFSKIIRCIQNIQVQTELSKKMDNMIQHLKDSEILKIAHKRDLLEMVSAVTPEYMKVYHPSKAKQRSQSEVLKTWIKPVKKALEVKCTQLTEKTKEIEEMKTEILELREKVRENYIRKMILSSEYRYIKQERKVILETIFRLKVNREGYIQVTPSRDTFKNPTRKGYARCISSYRSMCVVEMGTQYSSIYLKNGRNTNKIEKPTCVLIHKNGCFKAFGELALLLYAIHLDENSFGASKVEDKYSLYENFVTDLFNVTNTNSVLTTKSRCGREQPIQHILDLAITALWKLISSRYDVHTTEELHWVFIVPAFISHESIKLWKDAIYKAKMGEPLFVLDTDALSSSIYQAVLRNEEQYLVIDCGDNTVDITLYDTETELSNTEFDDLFPRRKLGKNMCQSHGEQIPVEARMTYSCALGGNLVNKYFATICKETGFTETTSNKSWLDIMQTFENKKRSLNDKWYVLECDREYARAITKRLSGDDLDENAQNIYSEVSFAWNTFCDDECSTSPPLDSLFHKRVNKANVSHPLSKDDKISTKRSEMQHKICYNSNLELCIAKECLEKPVANLIMHYIEDILQKPNLKNIKTILFKGGFSRSACMRAIIRKILVNKTIIFPEANADKDSEKANEEPDNADDNPVIQGAFMIAPKFYNLDTTTFSTKSKDHWDFLK